MGVGTEGSEGTGLGKEARAELGSEAVRECHNLFSECISGENEGFKTYCVLPFGHGGECSNVHRKKAPVDYGSISDRQIDAYLDVKQQGDEKMKQLKKMFGPDDKTAPTNANTRQVDGGHYLKYGAIQPWDCFIPWNLNGFQSEVLKLVVRYRDKNGVKDLQKAVHYLEKLIELELQENPF